MAILVAISAAESIWSERGGKSNPLGNPSKALAAQQPEYCAKATDPSRCKVLHEVDLGWGRRRQKYDHTQVEKRCADCECGDREEHQFESLV
jgi:hypothetical protein